MSRMTPLSNGKALAITVGATGLFAVLFLALPSPERPSPPAPPITNTGTARAPMTAESLFRSRCAQCHALPALTHRSPEDWRILVLKMNRYMQQTGRLFLTSSEAQAVTDYIVERQK
ncbi:MAG: c-type cytochrome [Leptospirillia bacterium]